MTDFETFLHDFADDKIFRIYKYKRMYTPFEQDKKYSDETVFENGAYPMYVYIRNAIELPDGDILLRMEETLPLYDRDTNDEDDTNDKSFIYEKLSDICIREYDSDNEININEGEI